MKVTRPVVIVALVLLVAAIAGAYFLMNSSQSGITFKPSEWSCSTTNSASMQFRLPQLPANTVLRMTVTDGKGHVATDTTVTFAQMATFRQDDGSYLIAGDGAPSDCDPTIGSYTVKFTNDATKKVLVQGTVRVKP